MHAWGPEGNLGCHSLCAVYLFFYYVYEYMLICACHMYGCQERRVGATSARVTGGCQPGCWELNLCALKSNKSEAIFKVLFVCCLKLAASLAWDSTSKLAWTDSEPQESCEEVP